MYEVNFYIWEGPCCFPANRVVHGTHYRCGKFNSLQDAISYAKKIKATQEANLMNQDGSLRCKDSIVIVPPHSPDQFQFPTKIEDLWTTEKRGCIKIVRREQ